MRAHLAAALADMARDARATAADLRADIKREAGLLVWHWQLRRRVREELKIIRCRTR